MGAVCDRAHFLGFSRSRRPFPLTLAYSLDCTIEQNGNTQRRINMDRMWT